MRKRAIVFLVLGVLLLGGALGLAGYNLYDEHRAQTSADASTAFLREFIPVKKAPEGGSDVPQYVIPEPQVMMTSVQVDDRGYIGILDIPQLGLSLPIQGDWSESLLKYSPCLYEGTTYDGLIIAGHNYRSHFAYISQLVVGDEITFTDVEGNVWTYRVEGSEIIDGYDVDRMKSGDWDLTLFTCTYTGQERFTLRCSMVIG